MNNEPVAWMLDYEISGIYGSEYRTNPFRFKTPTWDGNYAIKEITNAIPLYTHPAKTLTDEEIEDIWLKRPVGKAEDIFVFARAILKKASEK